MRFRRNLERIGEITAYEISKQLHYTPRKVETPLGEAEVALYDETLVIATILRAGLPFHQGFLNYFDNAENAFVSAYRKSHKDGTFNVKVEYISCGSLTGKTLLLVDPMLATGSSAVLVYNALVEKGGYPAHTHIASIIGSEQGVDYVQRHMSHATTTLWCSAVDEELTSRSYIVPGIGDAGDLAYGEKL
jgi:uracil phosphoribosyltransferase